MCIKELGVKNREKPFVARYNATPLKLMMIKPTRIIVDIKLYLYICTYIYRLSRSCIEVVTDYIVCSCNNTYSFHEFV